MLHVIGLITNHLLKESYILVHNEESFFLLLKIAVIVLQKKKTKCAHLKRIHKTFKMVSLMLQIC